MGTRVAVGVGAGFGRGSSPVDPAAATGLLAWYDFREGKTGNPITAMSRKAGTGLQDLSSGAGPDDEGDHASFVAASSEHLDGTTPANFTTLHRDGFLGLFLARLDTVSGAQTFFDNHSRNASGSRRGVSLYQNGTNLVFNVSNGGGTWVVTVAIGPSFGGFDAFTAGAWALCELGWEPDFGAYIRVNGSPPMVANIVSTPSSSDPLYVMCFGATSSGIGAISSYQNGDDAQLFFADETILQNRSEITDLAAFFAALQSVTLDADGEFITGAAVDTVLLATTRILTDAPNDFFKRGISNVDGSSRGITASVGSNAGYRDLDDRFRLFNGTSESTTLTLGSESTTLKSVTEGVAGTPRVCCIGDSRTAPTTGSTYVARLDARFGADIVLCGSNGTGANINEGRSGFDYEDIATNPASNLTDGGGSLDIASWHTSIGGAPDIYVLWSDVNAFVTRIASETTGESGWQAIVDSEMGHLQDIVDAIVAENADAIFIICTCPIYSKSAADWTAYNAAFTAAGRLACLDFIFRYWNPGLISAFGGQEGSDIYLCDLHTAVDGTRAPAGDPFHFSTLDGYGHDMIEQRIAAVLSDAA